VNIGNKDRAFTRPVNSPLWEQRQPFASDLYTAIHRKHSLVFNNLKQSIILPTEGVEIKMFINN